LQTMEFEPSVYKLSTLPTGVQSFAHVERWRRGPRFKIPEPEGMTLGVDTHTCALFIVFFETNEGKKAPIEPTMVPTLVEDASNAFEAVGATGLLGGLIKSYFLDVDPDACDFDPGACDVDPDVCDVDPGACDVDPGACDVGGRTDADQLVLFRDQKTTKVLKGNFDRDRHPDVCRVIRLSANSVCTSGRSVAWAMPCFMRVE